MCVLSWDRHRRGPSRKQPDLREPLAVPRCSEAPDRPGLPALGAGNRLVGHRQPVGTWGHVWGHGWGHICGDMGTQEHETWDVRDMSKWDMGTQTHMDKVTLTPESTGASPPSPRFSSVLYRVVQPIVHPCVSSLPSGCHPLLTHVPSVPSLSPASPTSSARTHGWRHGPRRWHARRPTCNPSARTLLSSPRP